MRPSNLIIKSIARKVMSKFGFGHSFHDLEYFEIGFISFHNPWILYKLEDTITKICRKNQFNIILSCFEQILDNYVFNISTYTLFAPSSKLCKLFLKYNCLHKLLDFVDQRVFQIFTIFSFTKLKVDMYVWFTATWTYACQCSCVLDCACTLDKYKFTLIWNDKEVYC